MKKLIQYVICGCILHNLLISEPIPAEWENAMNGNELDVDDELNAPISALAGGNERRYQLMCYLLEIRG